MSLPIPHFQAPWKTTAEHTITVAFEDTDSYNIVIAAGTAYSSTYEILADIWGQIYVADPPASVTAAEHFWLWINQTGQVSMRCDNDIFTITESTTATYKVLEWLGFSSSGYTDVASVMGSPHYRGWYPRMPLISAPTFSRGLNPLRASYRLRDGGVSHSTCLTPTGNRGGFISAKFEVEFLDSASTYAGSQNLYRLISYLTGVRTMASDLDYQGAGVPAFPPGILSYWAAGVEDMLDLDALPTGGVSENPIAYFPDWLDPADYIRPNLLLNAATASEETWYLHPDTDQVVISPRYDRMGTHWVFEFEGFAG